VEGPDTSKFIWNKVAEEISGVVRRGSGIETSVFGYDGTSIPTGASRITTHSEMLTHSVWSPWRTKNDRIWPIPDLHYFFLV